MTKSDFLDWKSHPITKEVFAQISSNIYGLQVELGGTAGKDAWADTLKVGAIQALSDILDMDFEMEDTP